LSVLVACPVIGPPADDVIASWDHRPHLVIVNGAFDAWRAALLDEPGAPWWFCADTNIGVAASWNLAFRRAERAGVGYVALVSQNLVLAGGISRLARLVDDHADRRGLLTDFAWRCIVLAVDVWRKVGPFDVGFWPGYYEDSDYVRRLQLAAVHTPTDPIPKVGRDLLDASRDDVAVTLRSGLIDPDAYARNGRRYLAKWGGPPFAERYGRPWDPDSAGLASNWDQEAG
jgi:hypothetical protein